MMLALSLLICFKLRFSFLGGKKRKARAYLSYLSTKLAFTFFWAGFFEVEVQGGSIDLGDFVIAKFLMKDALAHLQISRHSFLCNYFVFNGFSGAGFVEIECCF